MNKKLSSAFGRGFTLIELLVVISIIGILATLIVSNLNDARARARDSKRKTELNQLKTSLRLYYNDNQRFPANSAVIGSPGGLFDSADGNTVYMQQLPEAFTYSSSGSDNYSLKVALENASDPDIGKTQAACPGGAPFTATEYVICAN